MFTKKILCVGNETVDTDNIVSALAIKNATKNHGLISDKDFYPSLLGYYHTSLADLPAGSIVIKLAEHFDAIIMLDQDIDSYPHWKSFVNTFRMMIDLEEQGYITDFRNNLANVDILYWHNLVKTNKSICVSFYKFDQ